MPGEYVPEYAKGEILVCFFDKVEFGEKFGSALGYELSENQWNHAENVVTYKVPVGQEDEAIRIFTGYREFVDWAEKRDLKQEKRWGQLENIVRAAEELRDDVAISEEDYELALGKIAELALVKNK